MFDPLARLRARERALRSINSHLGDAQLDAWVRNLPATLSRVRDAWGVELTELPQSGASNLVVFGKQEGRDVAVKVFPDPTAMVNELRALEGPRLAGMSPPLVGTDQDLGLVIYDRIMPGTPGAGLPLADALRFAETVWGPAGGEGAPVGMNLEEACRPRIAWLRSLYPGDERYEKVAQAAESLLADLLNEAEAGERTQLHGDLLDKNFVVGAGGDPWLIDPRTMVGPVEADLALWIATRGQDLPSHITDAVRACPRLREPVLAKWVLFYCMAETRLRGRRMLPAASELALRFGLYGRVAPALEAELR